MASHTPPAVHTDSPVSRAAALEAIRRVGAFFPVLLIGEREAALLQHALGIVSAEISRLPDIDGGSPQRAPDTGMDVDALAPPRPATDPDAWDTGAAAYRTPVPPATIASLVHLVDAAPQGEPALDATESGGADASTSNDTVADPMVIGRGGAPVVLRGTNASAGCSHDTTAPPALGNQPREPVGHQLRAAFLSAYGGSHIGADLPGGPTVHPQLPPPWPAPDHSESITRAPRAMPTFWRKSPDVHVHRSASGSPLTHGTAA